MQKKKDRLFNARRLSYLVMAAAIAGISFYLKEYFMLAFSVYFVAMSFIKVGCASGACMYVPGKTRKLS